MYKGIFSFANILFLSIAIRICSTQPENLSTILNIETKPEDGVDLENTFFDTEIKNSCNYVNAGQRFNDEINSIGKCMNSDYESEIEKDRRTENSIKTGSNEYMNDDRRLISLEKPESTSESEDKLLGECSYYNTYPNYDEVFLPKNDN